MTPPDDLRDAIGFLVRSQLGEKTPWRFHDRSIRTPMNFTLDEASRTLGLEPTVVWVDGGYPALWTLTGLPVPVVVYSTRYVELTAYVRGLMADDWLARMRVELAERAILTIAAELALLERAEELAVRLFLHSKIGTGIYRSSRDILDDLELTPISERYMAAWFYGLVHELGHSWTPDPEFATTGLLSSETLDEALQRNLDAFSVAHEIDLKEIVERLRSGAADHPLSTTHLRGEVAADVFAASVLLAATIKILLELDPQQQLSPQHFVAEIYFYMNVIALLERCRGIVRLATAPQEPTDLELFLVQPATVGARLEVVQIHLAFALARYYGGEDATRWHEVVYQTMQQFAQEAQEIDTGLANAMTTAWSDDEPIQSLIARAAKEQSGDVFFGLEVAGFCDLAESSGVTGEAVQRLDALAIRS